MLMFYGLIWMYDVLEYLQGKILAVTAVLNRIVFCTNCLSFAT